MNMNRSIESSETQLVLFRSVNHGSQCSRPGDSLLPASVSAQARPTSPEHHVTAKKTRNVRIRTVSSRCAITRGAFFLCPYASFGLAREGRDGLRTGFPREGLCGVRHITLAAAHSGLVGPPGADRLHSSFTKGPIIFAPYLRMRSVAPLIDALSLSMGSKLEFY